MELELDDKLNDLLSVLKQDTRLLEIKALKEKLVSDDKLLNQINEYNINPYDKSLKENLFKNNDFKRYKELENEIYFLTLSINQILNRITDKRMCHNEDN